MKKVISLLIVAFISMGMLSGCGNSNGNSSGSSNGSNKGGSKVVVMKVKDYGDITIELYPDKAPKTVENFITHAKDGYYNGLTFHRIIKDFMIQGGDPQGTGTGGESIWKKPFEDEFSDLRHYNGAISMANSGPNTNGSQFFIVNNPNPTDVSSLEQLQVQAKSAGRGETAFSDEAKQKYSTEGGTPWLDKMHTVFGYVTGGMDIVNKIMAAEVDGADMPTTPIKIEGITVK